MEESTDNLFEEKKQSHGEVDAQVKNIKTSISSKPSKCNKIVSLDVSSELSDSEAECDSKSDDEFEICDKCLYCKDISRHKVRLKELYIRTNFMPSDLHMKPIKVPEEWHIAEEGQFDDAES